MFTNYTVVKRKTLGSDLTAFKKRHNSVKGCNIFTFPFTLRQGVQETDVSRNQPVA